MALNFPTNPVNGEVYDNYYWDAAAGVWNSLGNYAIPNLLSNATFTSSGSSIVPVTVKGAASQAANLQEWKNNSNTTLASISASGGLTLNNALTVGSGGTGTNTLASGGYLKGAGTSAITSQTGIPATDLTGTINHARMPTGSVLQIVYAATNTAATSASSTYVDTNLSASITPKFSTSKVLVLVNQVGLRKDNGNVENSIYLRLLRNGIEIGQFAALNMYSPAVSYLIGGSSSASILDSPGTTSALTYKTQMRNYVNAGTIGVQWYNDASTIILMEIAS